jgi:antitoxin HigA-1
MRLEWITRTTTDGDAQATTSGEAPRALCIEPLGISITDAAAALGVSRKTLSAVLNRRGGISPEQAIRLGRTLDTAPESWLDQQMMHDLYVAREAHGKI